MKLISCILLLFFFISLSLACVDVNDCFVLMQTHVKIAQDACAMLDTEEESPAAFWLDQRVQFAIAHIQDIATSLSLQLNPDAQSMEPSPEEVDQWLACQQASSPSDKLLALARVSYWSNLCMTSPDQGSLFDCVGNLETSIDWLVSLCDHPFADSSAERRRGTSQTVQTMVFELDPHAGNFSESLAQVVREAVAAMRGKQEIDEEMLQEILASISIEDALEFEDGYAYLDEADLPFDDQDPEDQHLASSFIQIQEEDDDDQKR